MSEQQRIAFLVHRDGLHGARAWVARTLHIYRQALAAGVGHAATQQSRPLFEQSIREFEQWLRETEAFRHE
jgi:hypothetical protein